MSISALSLFFVKLDCVSFLLLLTMSVHSWFIHLCHTVLTFMLSLCSYWSSFASKFQVKNVTKELDWLPAGYYTLPKTDEIPFYGMKTPLHLGLLVIEDTYCLAALALVISLAYSIGVRQFSVYTKGFTEIDYLNLEKKISQLMSQSNFGQRADVTVHHILSPSNANKASSHKTLNVSIVNPEDGKGMLVDLTKKISHQIQKGTLKPHEITSDYLDKLLQERLGCPDPDLVLKFGSCPTTCGYLPWQLRLTEIISFPSLKSFTRQKFRQALMAFSKIEQRFGK